MGKSKKLSALKKATAALLAAACIAVLPVIKPNMAAAVDYDQKIEELEAELERLKEENEQREQDIIGISGDIADNEYAMQLISDQIDGYNDEIIKYGEQITAMQQQIEIKIIEIENTEKAIEGKEEDIADKRIEIAALEEENRVNLEKFGQLSRALYMNDASDSLPILDGSDNWYDFFVYLDVVQSISKQNMKFMNDLLDDIHYQEELIEGLNDDIAQLNSDKSALQDKKKQMEEELANLNAKKVKVQEISDERYSKLEEYASYNESLEYKIYALRCEESEYEAEVERINQEIATNIRKKQEELSGKYNYSSDGFRWPLDSNYRYITTYFGYDAWRGGNHYGIDVGNGGIGGANIYAAQSGTVITASSGTWGGGYGNYVVIDHGGGLSTLYAHCQSLNVYEGQWVNKGDVIGWVGSTGWSTGNHLHFETRVGGVAQDPFGYTYEYI
ncbi:MAG: murein hydrolase activator EnvC family protein [Oscillospiraceae bacterium]